MEPDLLDWRCKGLPLGTSVRSDEVGTRGWSLLAGETGSPVAVLREESLRHNAAAMQRFCARHGVVLAPHAKTTMSPELTALQLAAGAWGLTVAVPHQVAVLQAFGVPRILLANEVADEAAWRWLAGRTAAPSGPEVLCYVDSLDGVRLADAALDGTAGGRVGVLVEVGHAGGRTGARSPGEAVAVARAVARSRSLRLAGVAGYEGTVGADREPATLAAVDRFLDTVAGTYRAVREDGLLEGGPAGAGEPLVSAGGSLFFDRVAARLAPLSGLGATVVLRSGCYLSHDDGFYSRLTPASVDGWGQDALRGSLEVWGRVVSRPDPGTAFVNVGRRDVSHDLGLPVVRWLVRDGVRIPGGELAVTGLWDQHACLQVTGGETAAPPVGTLVGLGVSHPCTTFDKWRVLLLVDDDDRVTGAVRTYF